VHDGAAGLAQRRDGGLHHGEHAFAREAELVVSRLVDDVLPDARADHLGDHDPKREDVGAQVGVALLHLR